LKSAITVSLGSKEDLKQLNIEGIGQCLRVLFAISNDAFITSSIRKCQVIGYQKSGSGDLISCTVLEPVSCAKH